LYSPDAKYIVITKIAKELLWM